MIKTSKKIFFCLIFLTSFLLWQNVEAATYYIDYETGDDSRTALQAQSKDTPWKTAPGMVSDLETVTAWSDLGNNQWQGTTASNYPSLVLFDDAVGTEVGASEVVSEFAYDGVGKTLTVYSIGDPSVTYSPNGIRVGYGDGEHYINYNHAAGDKFIFKGGVTWPYTRLPLIIQNSGATAGNPDIYIGGQLENPAWGSGYPIFNGEAPSGQRSDGSGGRTGISAYDKSNITISGIKIYHNGFGQRGISLGDIGSGGIDIGNMWMETQSVNAIDFSAGDGDKFWLHDSHFVDNVHTLFSREAQSTSIFTDVRIYNNIIEGLNSGTFKGVSHPDGIQLQGYGTANTFKNLKIYNNQFRGVWDIGGQAMLNLAGYDNAEIYNNLFTIEKIPDSGETWQVVVSAGYSEGWHSNGIKIYDNTMEYSYINTATTNAKYCIFVGSNQGIVEIKNNIFSGCLFGINSASKVNLSFTNGTVAPVANSYIHGDTSGATARFNSVRLASGSWLGGDAAGTMVLDIVTGVWQNGENILKEDDTVHAQSSSLAVIDTIIDSDYNIFNASEHPFTSLNPYDHFDTVGSLGATCLTEFMGSDSGWDCHSNKANPIINTAPSGTYGSGNYSLQSDSPAINAGTNLGVSYAADILGNVRSGTWDVGAYEYTGAADVVAPSAPSRLSVS